MAFGGAVAHAQGAGGAGGDHGISDPTAGSAGSNGVLTSGGGGGGGGGANTRAANGGQGGKGGSGKNGHGGGDGGAPGPAASNCKPQGAPVADGCPGEGNRNGANGIPVVPFAGAGHDGGSGGGGGGGQSIIVHENYSSGANDTLRGGHGGAGGAGGHGGDGHNGILVLIIVNIPTPGPAGSGGGGGGGGGGGVAVTAINGGSIFVNGSSSLYGGTGGDGGRGGNGGMGAPTIGVRGLPNIPRTDGNGGSGGNGGGGGAAAFLMNGGVATVDTYALLFGGIGGNGGGGGDGSHGQSLAGYGGTGGAGGHGGAGIVANGGVVNVTGQVTGGTGGNGGAGGNAINNNAFEGLVSAAGSGGNGGNGGAGAVIGTGGRIVIGSTGAVVGGSPGAGGAAGDGGGHPLSGINPRPDDPGRAGSAGVGIAASGTGVHIINAGQITGGTNTNQSQAAAITFVGGANTLELRAGSLISGNVIATRTPSAPNILALGGDQNAAFDLSGLGGQYQGFSVLAKSGASNWSLSHAPVSAIDDVRVDGGVLSLTNGASLTNMNGYVGFTGGSAGRVDVSGASSVWRVANLYVGSQGSGTLTVGDGALVDTRNLAIGGASAGKLIVSNGGRVRADLLQVGTSAERGALYIGADAGDAVKVPGTVSGAVNLAQNGALVFNHTSGSFLFNNLIAGTGAINVLSGTTILSGTNTGFAGTSDIRNGTLSVTGQLGGTIDVNVGGRLTGNGTVGTTTVNSGGTLAPDGSGRLTVNGNLALLPGGAFDFHLGHASFGGSTTSATVAVNGDLALSGATLNISASDEPALGYYRMMTYTGAGPSPGTTMVLGTTPPDPGPFNVTYTIDTNLAHVVDLVVIPNGINVLQSWADGAGPWTSVSNSWLDMVGGIVPASWGGKYGVFRGVGETITVEGTQSFAGLQFAGGTYNLVAGAGGQLRPTTFAGLEGIGELRVLAGEQATIAVPITGAGGINKTGGGTLVLSGTSDYTGGTVISGGTLQISRDDNLGAASGSLALDNGVLHTTAGFTSGRNVSLLGIGEINTDAATTLLWTGAVSGTGSLIKSGDGTLLLDHVNSWTGGTVIKAGTLELATSGALPDGGDVIVYGGKLNLAGYDVTTRYLIGFGGEIMLSGATLTLDQASDTVIASAITGPGGRLVKTGDGTLLLSGTNTYTNGTTIAGGTIAVSADANLGTGALTLAGGRLLTLADISSTRNIALTSSSTIEALFGTTYTTTGNVSGAGALTKDGWGTLVLAGSNTLSGGTTVAAGTLQIGNGGTTGTLTGNVVNNGVLAFNRSDTVFYNDVISGTGSLVQMGSGLTALSSNQTYSGGTLISAGTLQIGTGGTSGSITGDVINNGSLDIFRSDVYSFGGTVSGSGVLRNVGTGTTVLTADNTYSGGTTITRGSLQIGDGGLTGSIVGNVINNGALITRRDGLLTLAGNISGSGSFTQSGRGITRLDGLNTYAGATDVKVGTLSVNGSIASSSLVSVERGATLGGNGVVSTVQIADGGMLSPGNSVGLLTVQGNLTFASAASYMVEVSGAAADRTNVTGTAALSNATVRVSFDPAAFVRERYTILNAAGGVTGTFRGGVYSDEPPSFISTLSYDANNVYLNVDLNLTGLNINQTNIANSLNTYFGTHGGIPYALGAMTPEDITQASGELSTSVQQNTVQAMTQFMGVMTDPFAANRGLAMPQVQPHAFAAAGSWRDAYGAVTKAAPAAFESRWNVWAAGFGGGQSTDGNAVVGSHNASSRIGGIAVGADTWLSPQTLAGFAMAGGGTGFGLSDRLGSGQSDLFQVGGFVRHHAGPAYISAALAYGWQSVTTERLVTIIDADRLRANFTAHAFSGRIEAGHRSVLPWLGGVGATPYAAAQVTNIDLPAYAETLVSGADNFALNYTGRNVTATRSELGLRMDKSFALDQALLTLRGRAAWAHDFNRDRVAQAAFQSLPGASFVVNGAAMAPDAALTSASAEVMLGNGFSFAASYEGEFSSVTRSHAGKGVVRFVW